VTEFLIKQVYILYMLQYRIYNWSQAYWWNH